MIVKVVDCYRKDSVVAVVPASVSHPRNSDVMYATYERSSSFSPTAGLSYSMTPGHEWIDLREDVVLSHGHIEKQKEVR